MKNATKKVRHFLYRINYKGVLMAVVSGVLGVLIAMDVITPEQQASIMGNAEYILGLLVAIGAVRAGTDVKRYKDSEKRKNDKPTE